MKKMKIKDGEPSDVREHRSEITRSMMNIHAVMNVLKLPDDVVMALVYSDYFNSHLNGIQLMVDADEVAELAAKIEMLQHQQDVGLDETAYASAQAEDERDTNKTNPQK